MVNQSKYAIFIPIVGIILMFTLKNPLNIQNGLPDPTLFFVSAIIQALSLAIPIWLL